MIGDAVMSLPFIRSAAPVYDLHVTCPEHSVAVYKLVLPEERIIPWNPPWISEGGGLGKWRAANLPGFVARIRALHPDIAASVWADARGHVLMRLSGAPVRVGFPMTERNFYASQLDWRKRQIKIGAALTAAGSLLTLGPLLNRKVRRADYYQHHVEDFRDLSAALGVPWDETRPWLPAPARPAGAAPVWIVHPGARFEGRRWPVGLFGRIIREVLVPAGAQVKFVRAPEVSDELPALPESVEVLAPTSLPGFLDVCRGADFLLCNDTGVSHMGAALGKRVITIFSDQEPRWFAPRGSEADAVFREVCPHRPCLDRCVMPSYICLEAVTYEMVREKVVAALRESEVAGKGTVPS